MAVISNATSIIDNGAITAPLGKLTLLKTLTANNSGTIAFVHGSGGVDLTAYDEYVFKCISIHPVDDNCSFGMDIDTGANGNYNAQKTSTFERTYIHANNSSTGVEMTASFDLENSSNRQVLYNYGVFNFLIYLLFHRFIYSYLKKIKRINISIFRPFLSFYFIFIILSTVSHLIVYPSYFVYLTSFMGIIIGYTQNSSEFTNLSKTL